jgi:DNA-directed RNA polymerase alpha subunit
MAASTSSLIIEKMKLAAPAQRALAGAGITTVKQLATHTEEKIANLHGIGKNALEQLKAALETAGLAFKKE